MGKIVLKNGYKKKKMRAILTALIGLISILNAFPFFSISTEIKKTNTMYKAEVQFGRTKTDQKYPELEICWRYMEFLDGGLHHYSSFFCNINTLS